MRRVASLDLCAKECGARCCKAPGSLQLSIREAQRMNTYAGRELVYRAFGPNRVLMNFSENGGQCPLLAPDNSCSQYAGRPVGCHLFPQQPYAECLVWPKDD